MTNFDEDDPTEKFHSEFDQTEQKFQLAMEGPALTLKRNESERIMF